MTNPERRRSSVTSYFSCESSEPGPSSEDGNRADPDHRAYFVRAHRHELALQALLEWTLAIRWIVPKTDEDAVSAVFVTNPESRLLDGVRPDRGPAVVSSSDIYATRSTFVPLRDFVQECGGADRGADPPFLDFDHTEFLATSVVKTGLQQGGPRTQWLTKVGGCYARSGREEFQKEFAVSRVWNHATAGDDESRWASQFAELRHALVRFAALAFICPEFFEAKRLSPQEVGECLTQALGFIVNPHFWRDFVLALEENSSMEDVTMTLWVPLIEHWFDALASYRLESNHQSIVQAVLNASAISPIANAFVAHPHFLPLPLMTQPRGGGWLIIQQTLLGRLFGASPLDYVLTGSEPPGFEPLATRRFLKKALPQRGAEHNIVKTTYQNMITQLLQLVKNLLKLGPPQRHRTLLWFAVVLEANAPMAGAGFAHQYRALDEMGSLDPITFRVQNLSAPGPAINVATVLLMLTEPITVDRAPSLRPLYPALCRKGMLSDSLLFRNAGDSFGDLDSDPRGLPALEQDKTEPVKFPAQAFWLAMKCLHCILTPLLSIREVKQRRLMKLAQSRDPKLEKAFGEFECWDAAICNIQLVKALCHCIELGCALLLHCTWEPQVLAADKLAATLPPMDSPSSVDFAALPSNWYGDMLRAFDKYLILSAMLHPQIDPYNVPMDLLMGDLGMKLLATTLLFVLRDSQGIRDPAFRMDTVGYILGDTELNSGFKKALGFVPTWRQHLMECLVAGFIEAHKATYYQRIELRLILSREIGSLLVDAAQKQQLQHLASQDPETFERFVHYFASYAGWLLEEGIGCLVEVKKRELAEGGSQAANQEEQRRQGLSMDSVAQAVEGNRSVEDMPFEELTKHCQNLMDGGQHGVSVLKSLIKACAAAVRKSPILRNQIILYANTCIRHLAGPRCLQLKVSSFERYHFRPRELLAHIVQMFLALIHGVSDRNVLIREIIDESSGYDAGAFHKASNILKREGIVDASVCKEFHELAVACADASSSTNAEDLEDVPEEFLDPIMADIMEDPVTLPTSGHTLERRVIERHLMEEAFDPFNRKPLLKNDLIPNDELRARIQAWLQSKQRR